MPSTYSFNTIILSVFVSLIYGSKYKVSIKESCYPAGTGHKKQVSYIVSYTIYLHNVILT